MRPFLHILIAGFLGAILALLISRGFYKPVDQSPSPARHLAYAAAKGKAAVVWLQDQDASGRIDTASTGAGSGVIISQDGYIVTNYHVIGNNENIHVTMSDGRQYIATLVGADTSIDVALVKIEASGLPFLEFGNSDSIVLGEQVIGVGNPHRLAFTVTSGIISALERPVGIKGNRSPYFIQTDVPINNGNSGGPLLNARGEVIGLNIAFISVSGGYEGFTLAIPGNIVRKIADDLRVSGESRKGSLAMMIRNVNQDDANAAGMSNYEGVVVDAIHEGSSADTAGLRSLDVITSFDGIKVYSKKDFLEKLALSRPGDKVILGVNRGGKMMELEVVLEGS